MSLNKETSEKQPSALELDFEIQTKEETEPWKPSKPIVWACVAAFLFISVVDKILYDFLFQREGPKAYSIAIFFFLDACGRVAITSFLINWRTIWKKMSLNGILWVFGCRFGLQLGFTLGAMSIEYIGGGTFSMILQSQLLITGIFRYFVFNEKMSYNQIAYALATLIGAFAFKSNDIGGKIGLKGIGLGYTLISISCIVVSLFFVLTEKLLKQIMEKYEAWEKQFFLALVDIPVMIPIVYANILWDKYVLEKSLRTFNPFLGIDLICILISVNCIFFGYLLYFMFDWTDSVTVNILFVLTMAFTWPLELAFGFEEFLISRLLILCFTVVTCVGYQMESVQLRKTKELIEDLEKQSGHGPVSIESVESTTRR